MSFTPSHCGTNREFELIRQSLLSADTLPFTHALSAEHIQQAFDRNGVSFGHDEDDQTDSSQDRPRIVYTQAVTLWAMISQALFTGTLRSCRAAVQRVAVYYACLGLEVSGTNTGAYCRARTQITQGVVQDLAQGVAARCEADVPDAWLWHGLHVKMIDGTTFSMEDTPENQEEYPQPTSQAPGLGFPMMRAVAVTSLATGMVLAAETGPYAGKETGENALFRKLLPHVQKGDLILGDRHYCVCLMLALLQEQGVEFLVPLHQMRKTDFSQGKRLGKRDHTATWEKPVKAEWLDQETYDRLPEQISVRELEVKVAVPGFRTQTFVLVTSLRDAKTYPKTEIENLYRRRWTIELELRDIKTTMSLDVLRCKTPEAVRRELWTGLLTYNLIRQSMLQSALESERKPVELSFAASMQMLSNTWLLAAVLPLVETIGHAKLWGQLVSLRLLNGHSHVVGKRPNRVEPRAVKRRASPLAYLTELRTEARAKLLKSQTT